MIGSGLSRRCAAGVIGLMALAAAGCGESAPSGSSPAPPLPPPTPASSTGSAPAPPGPPADFMALPPCLEADRYLSGLTAVVTSGLTYQPPCLKVPAGTTVKIEASGVHPLEPGTGGSPGSPIPSQTVPVTVTFSRAGFFPYFCPEHTDLNMRGVIWVTES